jgi:hypothetical protein
MLFLLACVAAEAPVDADGDGVLDADDCAPNDPAIATPQTWYTDADGDGYGDPAAATSTACEAPAGYAPSADDCDDLDPAVHPGADESCKPGDSNCDGDPDDDAVDAPAHYTDADEDGYGDAASAIFRCDRPEGTADNDRDCDDADPTVHPGADEACDGVDNNCSGDESDAEDALTFYADTDNDGYGDDAHPVKDCSLPDTAAEVGGDCDDRDPGVNPGEDEACDNSTDDDCSPNPATCALDGTLTRWDASVGLDSPGTADGYFGMSIAVTDVDHDGNPDLVVGNGNCDDNGANAGAALVYAGPITAGDYPQTAVIDGLAGYQVGLEMANVGDLDGDGFDELAIAAQNVSLAGVTGGVFIAFEDPGAASTVEDLDAGIGLAQQWSPAIGSGPRAGGDTDGDGVDELLLGGYHGGLGHAFAFQPSRGNILSAESATWALAGPAGWDADGASDAFGATVAALGDDDGDGYDDFAVGAPGDDSGAKNAGCVYIFLGAATPVDSYEAVTARVLGTTIATQVGAHLSAADVDGDGAADLALVQMGASVDGLVLGPFSSAGDVELAFDGYEAITDYLAVGGDADADGLSELVYLDAYASVYLAYGVDDLASSRRGWTLDVTRTPALSANFLPLLADVSGDAYADVLVPVEADGNETSSSAFFPHRMGIGIQLGHGE